jgi:hypothetical protein
VVKGACVTGMVQVPKLRSSCCSAVEVMVRPGDHIINCWMVSVGGYIVSCITILLSLLLAICLDLHSYC